MGNFKAFGNRGEEFAAALLEEHGYHILATQYHCRGGEIDIIAEERNCYHFIEVKTRFGDAYGHPAEAVTTEKQKRIVRAARFYLAANHLHDVRVQFDVMEIEVGMIPDCI